MFTPESVVKDMLELAWQWLPFLATHYTLIIVFYLVTSKLALPSFETIYRDLVWSKANNVMSDVRSTWHFI